MQEGSPVIPAPVFGLDVGAHADGENGMAGGCGEHLFRSCVFSVGEVQIPACRNFEMSVSQLCQIAGETFSFGFKGLLGLLPTVVLHVFGEWNADETGDSAEAKESGVSAGGVCSASGPHVDEDLGTPAEELPPEAEEFAGTSGTGGVAVVAMDEVGVFEDGGGWRGFDVDREVGQQAAFGVWKGAGDQVECWECDKS